jgi:radical SAM superfamily enzyme YgiQ (UPF0313 family)
MLSSLLLVAPPILTEYSHPDAVVALARRYLSTPPLGILTVAALARQAGVEVRIIDASRVYFQALSSGHQSRDFPTFLAKQITSIEADAVGFGSMCDSYPLILLTMQLVKERRPARPLFLGGPQASATALPTLAAFPQVDYILQGEVEDTLPVFLNHGLSSPEQVAGLVYRDGKEICRNEVAPPPDLDHRPLPAYDLWLQEPLSEVVLEAGRGCPFQCRFCSTSSFFGQRMRMKSPLTLVREARELISRYGGSLAVLIHDHFLATADRARLFIDTWRDDPVCRSLPWYCSARLDALNQDTISMLASGGCKRIFIGVESGSAHLQKVIGKRLKLDDLELCLNHLEQAGIGSTVSFMMGFPEETPADRHDTIRLWTRLMLRSSVRLQIAPLAPLPDSDYQRTYSTQLIFDGMFSNLVSQGEELPEELADLVSAHPQVFPAHHAIPLRDEDRSVMIGSALFLRYASTRLQLLLPALANMMPGGAPEVVERWLKYRIEIPGSLLHTYYIAGPFLIDFLNFARSLPGDEVTLQRIHILVDVMEFATRPKHNPTNAISSEGDTLFPAYPILAIPCLYSSIQRAVRSGARLADVPEESGLVVLMSKDGRAVIHEPTPLVRDVLRIFVLPQSDEEIMSPLKRVISRHMPDGKAPAEVIQVVLDTLIDKGYLVRGSDTSSNPSR